jgi:hypothetical protein
MINGLYLPRSSAVLVLYLNDRWPISSGDPLSLLQARGPYQVYVNRNESSLICNDDLDVNCDSGDIIINEEIFQNLVLKSLNSHVIQCNKILKK